MTLKLHQVLPAKINYRINNDSTSPEGKTEKGFFSFIIVREISQSRTQLVADKKNASTKINNLLNFRCCTKKFSLRLLSSPFLNSLDKLESINHQRSRVLPCKQCRTETINSFNDPYRRWCYCVLWFVLSKVEDYVSD